MCTLTHAQGVSTGQLHSSVMTNQAEFDEKLVKAGLESGDCVFPILYAPEILIRDFDSNVADMKNASLNRSNAQCSGAGTFILQHIEGGKDFEGLWVHCDMVYPWRANATSASGHASGWGVAFVTSLFKEYLTNNEVL